MQFLTTQHHRCLWISQHGCSDETLSTAVEVSIFLEHFTISLTQFSVTFDQGESNSEKGESKECGLSRPRPTFFLPPVPRHQVPPLTSFYIFRPTCYSSLAGRSEFRNCPPSPSPSLIRGNHPPESPSILRGDPIIRGDSRPHRPPLPRHLRGLQRLSVAVQVKKLTLATFNSEEVDSVFG